MCSWPISPLRRECDGGDRARSSCRGHHPGLQGAGPRPLQAPCPCPGESLTLLDITKHASVVMSCFAGVPVLCGVISFTQALVHCVVMFSNVCYHSIIFFPSVPDLCILTHKYLLPQPFTSLSIPQDRTCIQFLAYVVAEGEGLLVDSAVETLALIAEAKECRSSLANTFGVLEALQSVTEWVMGFLTLGLCGWEITWGKHCLCWGEWYVELSPWTEE